MRTGNCKAKWPLTGRIFQGTKVKQVGNECQIWKRNKPNVNNAEGYLGHYGHWCGQF